MSGLATERSSDSIVVMAHDEGMIGTGERIRIDLAQYLEVEIWCQKFGCTEGSLRAAVRIVGDDAVAVSTWLATGRKPSDIDLRFADFTW